MQREGDRSDFTQGGHMTGVTLHYPDDRSDFTQEGTPDAGEGAEYERQCHDELLLGKTLACA